MMEHYTPWLILLPLVAGCLCFVFKRAARAIGVLLCLGHCCLSVFAVFAFVKSGEQSVAMGGWLPPLGIALEATAIGLLLISFASFIFLICFVHGTRSLEVGRVWLFYSLASIVLAGVSGIFLSRDLFNIYVLIEIVGLGAVALVAISPGSKSPPAAFQYLMVNIIGSLCFLFGVAIIYRHLGVLDFTLIEQQITDSTQAKLAAALITAGLALKSALYPLHFWLPRAHGSAMSVVSAMLSGVIIKCNFFLLLVLWTSVFASIFSPTIALIFEISGAAAILFGSLRAVLADRLKQMAACSTVAQLGYLFLFIPLANQLVRVNDQVVAAVLMFIVAHGIAKTLMFLGIERLKVAEGHDEIDALQGTAMRQPLAVFAIAVAGTSLIGFPPTAGFTAKWLLLDLSLAAGNWLLFTIVILGSLLACGYLFRMLSITFSSDLPEPARHGGECLSAHSSATTHCLLILMLITVLIGFSLPWISLVLQGAGP